MISSKYKVSFKDICSQELFGILMCGYNVFHTNVPNRLECLEHLRIFGEVSKTSFHLILNRIYKINLS